MATALDDVLRIHENMSNMINNFKLDDYRARMAEARYYRSPRGQSDIIQLETDRMNYTQQMSEQRMAYEQAGNIKNQLLELKKDPELASLAPAIDSIVLSMDSDNPLAVAKASMNGRAFIEQISLGKQAKETSLQEFKQKEGMRQESDILVDNAKQGNRIELENIRKENNIKVALAREAANRDKQLEIRELNIDQTGKKTEGGERHAWIINKQTGEKKYVAPVERTFNAGLNIGGFDEAEPGSGITPEAVGEMNLPPMQPSINPPQQQQTQPMQQDTIGTVNSDTVSVKSYEEVINLPDGAIFEYQGIRYRKMPNGMADRIDNALFNRPVGYQPVNNDTIQNTQVQQTKNTIPLSNRPTNYQVNEFVSKPNADTLQYGPPPYDKNNIDTISASEGWKADSIRLSNELNSIINNAKADSVGFYELKMEMRKNSTLRDSLLRLDTEIKKLLGVTDELNKDIAFQQ